MHEAMHEYHMARAELEAFDADDGPDDDVDDILDRLFDAERAVATAPVRNTRDVLAKVLVLATVINDEENGGPQHDDVADALIASIARDVGRQQS